MPSGLDTPYPPPPETAGESLAPPPRPLWHPLLRSALYLVLFFVAQALAGGAVVLASLAAGVDLTVPGNLGELQGEGLLLIFAVTVPPLLAVTWLFARFLDRRSLASLGLRWPLGGRGATARQAVTVPLGTLGFLAGWTAVLLALPGVTLRLGGLAPEVEAAGFAAALRFALLLLGFLIQGGVEELVIRGYIFHALKERWAPFVAAVASSVLFALLHALNPNVSAIALTNVVLAGVILAALVERSGSLWGATLAHGAWNFSVACLLSVPVSGIRTFHLLDLAIDGPALLTGGGFGPEGSLALTALGLALAAWLWRPRHRNLEEIGP